MTKVRFTFVDIQGNPLPLMQFTLLVRRASFNDADVGVTLPEELSVTTDETGKVIVELWPLKTAYRIQIAQEYEEICGKLNWSFYVPHTDEVVEAQSLFLVPPPSNVPWDEEAIGKITQAVIDSHDSAVASESSAIRAEQAAQSIEGDALRAEVAAAASEASAGSSANSAIAASTSAGQAASSATSAAGFRNQANTAATNALASQNAAKTSETNSKASETAASTSATNAGNSASASAASAAQALASKNSAETAASTATTKASEAVASATSAAGSATTATTQANRAKTEADKSAASASVIVASGWGLVDAVRMPDGTNLNNLPYINGNYTIAGNSNTNVPEGTQNGHVLVQCTPNFARQTFRQMGEARTWERTGQASGNTWSSWFRTSRVGDYGLGPSLNDDGAIAGYVFTGNIDDLKSAAPAIAGRPGTAFFKLSGATTGTFPPTNNGFNGGLLQVQCWDAGTTTQTLNFVGGTYVRDVSGASYTPWRKSAQVGGDLGNGLAGLNPFNGNIDTLIGSATQGLTAYNLTSQTTGMLPPGFAATSAFNASSLLMMKWDANWGRQWLSGGAGGAGGAIGGTFTRLITQGSQGPWLLEYNNQNSLNPVDNANGRAGVMDNQTIGAWRVNRFANGFAIVSAPMNGLSLAAGEIKTTSFSIPISMSDWGKCSVGVTATPSVTNDHYGVISALMDSPTAGVFVVRNGATAQQFGIFNVTVTGFWK